MALIRCSECGKEVSTQATACPHCGCPVAVILKEGATASDPQPAPKPPEPLDPKWEKWGSQQASAPPASATSPAPEQQSAGQSQQQKAGKGLGCLAIIILAVVIGWLADLSGCGSSGDKPGAGQNTSLPFETKLVNSKGQGGWVLFIQNARPLYDRANMFGSLDEEATVRVLRGPEPDDLGQQQMFQVSVLTGKHTGRTGWIVAGAIGR